MRRTLLLLIAPALVAQTTTIEEILVVVNNHIITRKAFQQSVEQQYSELYRHFSGKELDEKLKDAREKTLTEMVDTFVLLDVATENNIQDNAPTEKEILADFLQRNSLSESDMEKAVRAELGLSLNEFLRMQRESTIIQNLLWMEVFRKVPVEDQEARLYYNEHQAEYKKPARFRIRELIIAKGATPSELQSAKETLAIIQEEVAKGTSFESLVTKYSTSPSKGTGGDIGWVDKGLLLQSIEDTALSLKPDEVGNAIETDKDYILIQLIGSEQEGILPFDTVKTQIINKLREPKAENARMHYLQAQRLRANIRYIVPKEQIIGAG
ncbi:MAG: peptidyl-prolyl cis-trans isomerase [Holophagaceae bacterium]|nr:peptidyl-prolyl cis-trans isomerase [Holophagaceae bacterium]